MPTIVADPKYRKYLLEGFRKIKSRKIMTIIEEA
jgi:hypothetical protein